MQGRDAAPHDRPITDSGSQSDDSIVRGPDPELVIPEAQLADDALIDLVVESLESSAFIEVARLEKTGGKCDLLLTEALDDW